MRGRRQHTAAGSWPAAACVAVALAGLVACASPVTETGDDPAATASAPDTGAPLVGDGGETAGPDTDPLLGRVTPELVDIDPCSLLTGREVGTVTGTPVPFGTEGRELRTDQRACAWPGLTVVMAARAESATATLESRLTYDVVEDLLGLPLPALLAVSDDGDGDGATRSAVGVSMSFGGGYQLALLPSEPIEIGTDTWEALLELARAAAPRVPL